MKYGILKILGLIGNVYDENGEVIQKGMSLVDIIAQVKALGLVDEYVVVIDSMGGNVDVGYDIYDYLVGLKKPITTIAYNECSSIATVPFQAGDKGKRLIVAGTKSLVHNPWVANASGNASQLTNLAEVVQAEEDKLLAFYSKATGVPKEGISPVMKNETVLNPQECIAIGFADKVITVQDLNKYGSIKVTASSQKPIAIFNLKKTTMKKKTRSAAEIMAAIKAAIKGEPAIVALDYKSNDGKAISVASTGEAPQVGDVVTVDGAAAPSATLTLEDGTVIETDANSAISAIETSQEEATEAMAVLVEAIEQKDAEIVKLKADHVAALALAKSENEKELSKINAQLTILANSKGSQHKPAGQGATFRKPGTQGAAIDKKEVVAAAIAKFSRRGKKEDEKK